MFDDPVPFRDDRSSGKAPVLLLIGCGVIGLLVLAPIAYLSVRAFGQADGARIGAAIFSSSTLEYLLRSLALAAVVVVVSVGLSIALAWATCAEDLPARRLFDVVIVAPLAIPCYVGAAIYLGAMSPGGFLGWIGSGLGLAPGWFSGFWASAFVLVLFIHPLAYLPIRAGIARLDPGPFDAARLLGCSRIEAARRALLPQLRPSILVGSMVVALYTLSEFGAVSLLRCNTFTRVIYLQYESAFDRVGASLSSLVLVLVIAVLLLFGARLGGRTRTNRSGRPARPLRWRLGRGRWVILSVVGVVAALALVVPIASLLSWWSRSGVATGSVAGIGGALVTTILLSLAAGLLVVACSIPLAILCSRYPSRSGFLIERLAHLGFGLPGIVVGLALVFLSLHLVPWLYQTWVVVVIGYLVLFLALGTGPIRVGFEQASIRAEEAARTLGAGRWARLRLVTLPVVLPGLVSSFLLVFISTSKELPNTLLLAPAGTHTLATRVWQYTEEAMYAEAALPALVLIVISILLVGVMVWREDLLERTQ